MATPTIGGYQSPLTGGGSDASTTPAATTATPAVSGPSGAGLNPAASSTTQTGLDPSIASKPLPDAKAIGATEAKPSTVLDENKIVSELADHLGVKAGKGKSLEAQVVEKLASQYGVKVPLTTEGTGTGQGEAGQIRHNIASWFSTAYDWGTSVHLPGAPSSKAEWQQKYDAALKIQSPKLKEQAIKKLQASNPDNQGTPPGTPEAVPDESKKALQGMLGKVVHKLGVSQAPEGTELEEVASQNKLPTETPASPATPGGAQTAGDAYQTFVKNLSDKKTSVAFAKLYVPAFEQAGLLDQNQAGAKQANGTTFTNAQIANAYQQVISQQVTKNQGYGDALKDLASNTGTAGGPTSEMQAYVQGVAQEFGVGLTTQQITAISNQYGQNATTADDPSSVEDEIKDAVVSLYDPTNPGNPSGVADTMYTDIQQAALQYQIPISAQQIGTMVKTSLQGATVESMYVAADAAEAAATKQFQEQAQGLYPALSSQIAAGQTVQNLVAPYFNVAEAYTGVPASTMMADQATGGPSKWAAFLQGGQNPSGSTQTAPGQTDKTGGPQMMTLDQWKTTLMQDPKYGFQNTQGAKDMAEQMTSAILNEFGKVNTNGGSSQPFGAYNGASDLSANTS